MRNRSTAPEGSARPATRKPTSHRERAEFSVAEKIVGDRNHRSQIFLHLPGMLADGFRDRHEDQAELVQRDRNRDPIEDRIARDLAARGIFLVGLRLDAFRSIATSRKEMPSFS